MGESNGLEKGVNLRYSRTTSKGSLLIYFHLNILEREEII